MQIRGRQLALTWIGCFLGAGFVSGQEIHQFFGHFGWWGILGLILAVTGLAFLCGLIFQLARSTGFDEVHRIAVPGHHPILQTGAGIVAISFMFGIYVVMCAGAGTLLEQITGSRGLHLLGSAVFCLMVTLIAIRGVGGAVQVSRRIIPVLLVLSLIVMTAAIVTFGRHGIAIHPSNTANPLVNHWGLACVTFISYNFLCSMGTLSALGTMVRSRRDLWFGVALGGVLLLLISMGVNLATLSLPDSLSAELPMLYLAGALHPALEVIYAIVIFLGMFTASMAVFVPVPQYLLRLPRLQGHTVLVPVLLSTAAFSLSQLGFSNLIGTMFPVFGFVGFVFIGGMLIHCMQVWKAGRPSHSEGEKKTGGNHGKNQQFDPAP